MITPSDVLEFLYCNRFTYFLNVLKIAQYEEKRYKVRKGREIHRKRLEQNKDYLRKKIPVKKKAVDVYMASPKFRIRGRVDEVYWLNDDTMAPMDYKYTLFRDYTFRSHKIQIVLYGLLVEETYHLPVERGYIAYIRGGSKTHEVPMTVSIKQSALNIVDGIFNIIGNENIPPQTKYRIRCADCCYKNICA